MRETTPDERSKIADEVCGSGFIHSTEELVERYREYAQKELANRYDDTENPVAVAKIAGMYSDMATRCFEHDLPALVVLFKRYMTQH